jgi:hypothetical protein
VPNFQACLACLTGLLAPMGKNVINPSRDYYVVTKAHGHPPAWTWEIQRRSRPLGVRIYGDGFGSETVENFVPGFKASGGLGSVRRRTHSTEIIEKLNREIRPGRCYNTDADRRLPT